MSRATVSRLVRLGIYLTRMRGVIAIMWLPLLMLTSLTTNSSKSRLRETCCPQRRSRKKREQFVATGFLALGVKDVNQRFKVRYDMDNVDEQIDAVSRSVLALTVSCARCHDHKFDPISSRDYYALAGIFASTELCDALRNQMGGSGLAY